MNTQNSERFRAVITHLVRAEGVLAVEEAGANRTEDEVAAGRKANSALEKYRNFLRETRNLGKAPREADGNLQSVSVALYTS